MKKVLFFFFILWSVSAVTVNAQEPSQQDMMKAWQEYMTPGAMHQFLSNEVGEWKTEIKMWLDPAAPPTTSEGTATGEALLGGRYFQMKHKSSFNGMPFEGIQTDGFDNAKKTFFSTWIDNMGTGVLVMEGKYDEAAKTLTYTGTMADMLGKDIKIREIIKIIDQNNFYMEMFQEMDGKEFKSMELKMTKKI